MLDNIVVVTSDLIKVRADIQKYFLHKDDTDFDDEINFAKRQVQREIRNREQSLTGLSGSDLQNRLDTIKDIEGDECLKDKIILLTISQIFRNNSYLDLASEYLHLANQIELEYTITGDDTEQINNAPVGFTR